MNWIAADILMFVCSVGMYLLVRKAALNDVSSQFNNLAMFAIPVVVFLFAAIASGDNFAVTWCQAADLVVTALVFSYAGNAMSTRSIALAPNPGYSLVLSKSYVVVTTIWAVIFFNSPLTLRGTVAIALIVLASALVTIDRRANRARTKAEWLPLAFGSFFCWAFLSLMAKYLTSHGISTLVFLTYVMGIVVVCIVVEMRLKGQTLEPIKRHIGVFALIGLAATGYNFFNFYAIKVAPNVGYVNATNAASIGAVTVFSAVMFGDELTKQKIVGIAGVIAGLLLLLI